MSQPAVISGHLLTLPMEGWSFPGGMSNGRSAHDPGHPPGEAALADATDVSTFGKDSLVHRTIAAIIR
jgi:hypothetical protein